MKLFRKHKPEPKAFEVFARILSDREPQQIITVTDELQARLLVSSYIQMSNEAYYKPVY